MIHTATIKIKVVLGEPLAATTPAPIPAALPLSAVQTAALPAGGEHAYRVGGERHLWTPQAIADFRQAVREGDYESFKR